MRSLVIIDGENFLHRIFDVLSAKGLVRTKLQLTKIDVRGIVETALGEKNVEIRYFGTKTRQLPPEHPLSKKSTEIIDHQRRFLSTLHSQKIMFHKVGKLKVSDGRECFHCGNKSPRLAEKGVDVGIAIELLKHCYEKTNCRLVLFSSDTDLLPAIKLAKQLKRNISYLCFDNSVTDALVNNCVETIIINEADVLESYKNFLSIQIA